MIKTVCFLSKNHANVAFFISNAENKETATVHTSFKWLLPLTAFFLQRENAYGPELPRCSSVPPIVLTVSAR